MLASHDHFGIKLGVSENGYVIINNVYSAGLRDFVVEKKKKVFCELCEGQRCPFMACEF